MKKELRPALSQNLIKARKTHRWSQSKAASMLGINAKAYASWEEGRANPDVSLLPLIAHVFNITSLLSFLENPLFSMSNQDAGFKIDLSTPLEEKYLSATPTAQAIVDLTLGIGKDALTC